MCSVIITHTYRRFGWNWLAEIFHPYDARAYKGLVGSN